MIDLIKQIFEDNNSYSIKLPSFIGDLNVSGFFSISNNAERKEYFLVLQTDDLVPFISKTDTEKSFEKIYSLLVKEDFYKPYFNKNTTLLFLCKSESPLPAEKLKRQIYEVEENPYFFKKHVLIFTDNQVTDLKSKCEIISITSLEDLVNNINFEEFKANPYSDDYKQLLLNIYVKCSFLKTPNKKKDIENLSSKVSNRLSANAEIEDLEIIRLMLMEDDGTKSVYELFNIPKKLA